MKAIGNNLIVNMTKQGVSETKGGLFLAEKQREDIRYAEGTVLSAGSNVIGVNENDVIYFDKNNCHQIFPFQTFQHNDIGSNSDKRS